MVKKFNANQFNDPSNSIEKAKYDTKIIEIENKIPDHGKRTTANNFNK